MEFSLTVANEMLSLIGSIQPDPLNPAHVQQYVPPQVASRKTHSKPNIQVQSMEELDEEVFNEKEEEDEEEEDDTFTQLAKAKKEKTTKAAEKSRKKESKKKSK
jgi:DNA-directed RNA polymerase I subunit RPA43